MLMKRLTRYFLRGLVAILPVVLTLYLLVMFLSWAESFAYALLRPVIGSFYVPGLGLIFAVLIVLGVGWLLSKREVQRLMRFVELPFTNIPVIKSIYSSLKSFADYFTPSGNKAKAQQVVLLRWPGGALEMVGLVTRRGMQGLPDGFTQGDRVAVYLPMGYNIGGYTVFVPADWVTPIDMSVEEAMRSSLIGWMARSTDPHPANGGGAAAGVPGAPAGGMPPFAAPAGPMAAPAARTAAGPAGAAAATTVATSHGVADPGMASGPAAIPPAAGVQPFPPAGPTDRF